MKRIKQKRPQLKLKPGLKDTKKVNDLIINGEHEFKQEEQYFQLSASTTSKIDRQRGNFQRVMTIDSIGAPDANRFVYSSFDARPFNARDINTQSNAVLVDTGVGGIGYWDCSFRVPANYVFVFRKLSGYQIPAAGGAVNNVAILANLQIDGVTDPNNQNIPVYNGTLLRELNFYTIVNENSVLNIHFVTTQAASFANHIIYATLSGTLLVKTGVPANFEAGFDTTPMTTFKPVDKKTMYRQPARIKS